MKSRDADFFGWAGEQASLLRAGRLNELDINNLIEEIESMGKSERRELDSRLRELLMHLIKWQWQPERRGNSWLVSISKQRVGIADVLSDSPSLKPTTPEAMEKAWPLAVRYASLETGINARVFPDTCPWGIDQVLDDDWLPE